tara:strand:- start:440 stop:1582 length:1143 start_codon:yes stop_codon:yes gene_type:complete
MTSKNHDNNEHLQQQVFFSERDTLVEKSDPLKRETAFKNDETGSSHTAQVIFNNDEYSPLISDEHGLDQIRQSELNTEQLYQDVTDVQGPKYSWLWRIIGASFMILLVIEAVNFFMLGFEQSPFITSIYALLLTALTFVAGNSLWRELIGLRRFKRRQKMKVQAVEFLIQTPIKSQGGTKRAKAFCDNISESLPCDLVFDLDSAKEQQTWQDAVSSDYSSAELVQLYSRVILTKVDEKALNEVAKFSTEAVVLIALSPVALLDMLIMLSRNLRMINKIAGLYGLKLGYWSRIKLIKQVFVNMAYAGASELIADFGSDMLGAELLGKLSARFAQGLGAGMLTARLGAKTMELCRPIPFKEKPKLTQVRKKIAQQIKSLVSY